MYKVLALAGAGVLMLGIAVYAFWENDLSSRSALASNVAPVSRPSVDELTKRAREIGLEIGFKAAKAKKHNNRVYCAPLPLKELSTHPFLQEHPGYDKVMAEATERGCLSYVNQVNRALARK